MFKDMLLNFKEPQRRYQENCSATLIFIYVKHVIIFQCCRIERQAFGPSYTMDIFRNSGYIYVAKSSVPPCSELQELIRLCKGKITTSRIRARIVIGEKIDIEDVICVKELWILDSIEHKRLKSFKNYLYD